MTRTRNTGEAATPATRALVDRGIPFTVHRYTHDPAVADFGGEAARALDVAAERIFKTLIVDSGDALGVVIIPVTARMNTSHAAAALGVKRVRLADSATAERQTGFIVGGISPFGQKRALRTVIDDSCTRYETILVSGGRRGFDIEVTAADLLAVTHGTAAALT